MDAHVAVPIGHGCREQRIDRCRYSYRYTDIDIQITMRKRFGNAQEEIEWHDVPPEWRLWLRYARKEPPTEPEIQKGEAQRAYTLARAKEIEEEDQRQRSLEIATGVVHREEAGGNDDQARNNIAYLAGRVHSRGAGARSADAKPRTASSEATGRGETFKVGVWNPDA
jgi:NADH:ubiquinone oxidoreductase subunit